jgi:type III secretion system FlhB-like substrate exporter
MKIKKGKQRIEITDCFEVYIQNDYDLVQDFLKFQIDNTIYGPRGGHCGLGDMLSFIYLVHKEKVLQFFKDRNKKIINIEGD